MMQVLEECEACRLTTSGRCPMHTPQVTVTVPTTITWPPTFTFTPFQLLDEADVGNPKLVNLGLQWGNNTIFCLRASIPDGW